jgi:hypothetical protein
MADRADHLPASVRMAHGTPLAPTAVLVAGAGPTPIPSIRADAATPIASIRADAATPIASIRADAATLAPCSALQPSPGAALSDHPRHSRKEIEAMAKVTGVKEKLHSPIYDALFLEEGDTLEAFLERTDPRVIRFFVDVQQKTRLETNLQASGVLPSMNTFEARALRVVISNTTPDVEDADLFIPNLIYNTIITFLVGEKEAITAPTYMFPAGAGVISGNGDTPANHGQPDPLATFRFSEPVFIEPHQNFRVEMLFPRVPPPALLEASGPRRVWVVLDGYLTRDVQ